jgi:hypothetical protein
MKKKVQIVTIPLNKDGWNNGDIIINTSQKKPIASLTSASFGKFVADELMKDTWKAQQLLVLSNDAMREKDWIFCNLKNNVNSNKLIRTLTTRYFIQGGWKKVIASYPQLEGTLPLSKETIQQWIDNGTPEEGSVDFQLVRPCDLRDDQHREEDKLLTYFNIDSQGNLILEFDKKQTYEEMLEEKFIKMASSALGSANVSPEFRDWVFKAPIVPTDEEIKQKAISEVDGKTESNIDSPLRKRLEQMYISGYKQALKDLGYEK